MGPLGQVGPLRQESTGPFGDNGAPEASWGPRTSGTAKESQKDTFMVTMGPLKLAGAPRVQSGPRAPKCVMHMYVSWSQNVLSVTRARRVPKSQWGSFEYHGP